MRTRPTAARVRARARLGLLGLGLAAACRPAADSTPPGATTEGGAPASAGEAASAGDVAHGEPAQDEPAPCGAVGERFTDHTWAPSAATTVASVQLDDPALPQALRALADHVRTPGHGLPIPLSFSLGEWTWQVPVLVATLRRAGLRPAELVFVSVEAADHAWLWRSTCDLDAVVARIETAWAVEARRTVEGMVATPRAPAPGADAPAFPYDVLLLPGERMALVPAGRAAALLDRLGRPGPSLGLGGAPTVTAGRRLDELDAAPVRLVVLGRALLDPAAPAADHDARVLRVTGEGVEASPSPAGDASLPPPS